ncbi:L-alanine-DL-glutamate epimerase-like enolase superfamily enzyme [Anseongella ginsenosidimutans]|uniref:L-alanine-DL-glutamate epimerase-like enolase superfamily enzyme n=1 Tax=Anseongella ginsenosidimutans TaxID=496056 RepID=A0A4R3KP75_9SPHI|nr:mandelate racemase/muconate lactonizing enzyme family protein [Anseongella ginsenosidimutans]QEC51933.1 mandelate racemase/muconate lactonizing enzyme family protein [Anseongella ginsenosidimutans]TCS85036.1 L-alanine-DL-glutamate epimerase-like enolase superfamily enzyme [Anseongella ginsenosidimutans]
MHTEAILCETFSIKEISCRILKPIVFPKPFYDSTMGPFSSYETTVLTLVDDSGFTGEIEYPVSCFPFFKKYLLPVLLESHNSSYPDIYKKMFWRIRNEGFRGEAARALGYLDRVFYDIASRRAGKPLHRYLGAERSWAMVYASGGSTALSDTELIEECLSYKEKGYSVIKIKAGGDFASHLQQDVKRIEKVRIALGNNIQLAVDLNQALTVDQARDFIEQIADLDIYWLEEPIHSADILGMSALTETTNMCLSFGESERLAHPFHLMLNAGIRHFQPVANSMISIAEFKAVCYLAASHGLMLSCGSFPNVNAQLIATLGEDAMCEYLIPYLKPMDPYFKVQPSVSNGKIILPEIEGISIRFDWDRIKKENMIRDSVVWKPKR